MKGFEAFMANPYWKAFYDNAPGENLKRYIFNSFEQSWATFEPGYEPERLERGSLSMEELQYLYDNSDNAYKKALLKAALKRLKSICH